MLRELVRDGATLLLTTQYLEEADRLADDIVVLDHGRVVATGSPPSSRRASAASASRSPSRGADELAAAAAALGRSPTAPPRVDAEAAA